MPQAACQWFRVVTSRSGEILMVRALSLYFNLARVKGVKARITSFTLQIHQHSRNTAKLIITEQYFQTQHMQKQICASCNCDNLSIRCIIKTHAVCSKHMSVHGSRVRIVGGLGEGEGVNPQLLSTPVNAS